MTDHAKTANLIAAEMAASSNRSFGWVGMLEKRIIVSALERAEADGWREGLKAAHAVVEARYNEILAQPMIANDATRGTHDAMTRIAALLNPPRQPPTPRFGEDGHNSPAYYAELIRGMNTKGAAAVIAQAVSDARKEGYAAREAELEGAYRRSLGVDPPRQPDQPKAHCRKCHSPFHATDACVCTCYHGGSDGDCPYHDATPPVSEQPDEPREKTCPHAAYRSRWNEDGSRFCGGSCACDCHVKRQTMPHSATWPRRGEHDDRL